MVEVERHWGLSDFPFREGPSPFVPTPTHAAAVARLRQSVESEHRLAVLEAPGGLGKTMVLDRVLDDLRSPHRRLARSSAANDGTTLLADLAASLGVRVRPGSPWAVAWKALADAARLCRLQGLTVVLALDDIHEADDPRTLDRLLHLNARLTVLRVGRPCGAEPDSWSPLVRLLPLTRTEAGQYLNTKLAASGRDGPTFTPRALARVHAISGGVPRALDRLASRTLREGACQGREIVGLEVVEEVAANWAIPGLG